MVGKETPNNFPPCCSEGKTESSALQERIIQIFISEMPVLVVQMHLLIH